jgi:hypothetical protein
LGKGDEGGAGAGVLLVSRLELAERNRHRGRSLKGLRAAEQTGRAHLRLTNSRKCLGGGDRGGES